VLEEQLPVGTDIVLGGSLDDLPSAKDLHRIHGQVDQLARLAEEVRKRGCVRSEIDEIHSAIAVDVRRFDQSAPGFTEVLDISRWIGHADEPAAIVMRPAMIKAHERAGIAAVLAAHQRTAMQA